MPVDSKDYLGKFVLLKRPLAQPCADAYLWVHVTGFVGDDILMGVLDRDPLIGTTELMAGQKIRLTRDEILQVIDG